MIRMIALLSSFFIVQGVGTERVQYQIFLSLGMPDQALSQWLIQASKYQIPITIRGVLPTGFRPTMERIQDIIKRHQGRSIGLHIDPMLFRRFNIVQVPAVVAWYRDDLKKKRDAVFEVVYGNVSLDTALDVLRKAHGRTSP